MGNQLEQVGAVDRWVGEAGSRSVSVGVQAAAAAGDHGALPARLAEAGQSLLTRGNAGMLLDIVESVLEDIESGSGRAVERRLQGIGLFVRPVGLDDDEADGREPQSFGAAL